MKVKYIGSVECSDLTYGNIYECLGQELDCYRVIDESEEDYLYPTFEFEVVEEQGSFDSGYIGKADHFTEEGLLFFCVFQKCDMDGKNMIQTGVGNFIIYNKKMYIGNSDYERKKENYNAII